MFWPEKIYRAPPNSGTLQLGRTLPSLLDEACDRYPNAQAFQQWSPKGWQFWSNRDLQIAVNELALGLLKLGLQPGDRIALYLHSDVNFCIADLGCLLAQLVNVPIFLGETLENIRFILQHSEATALIVSDLDLLDQIAPCLQDTRLETIIVAAVDPARISQNATDQQPKRTGYQKSRVLKNHNLLFSLAFPFPVASRSSLPASFPHFPLPPAPLPKALSFKDVPWKLPTGVQVYALADVRSSGLTPSGKDTLIQVRAAIGPDDLATIIYIAGITGQCQLLHAQQQLPIFQLANTLRQRFQSVQPVPYQCETPKGVMLSHENLSADALAAFSSFPELKPGNPEIVLSFLPLTHILARVLLYGHINYGHRIVFSTPNRVVKHLREIRPTILTTVPRLLEKMHQKLVEKGGQRQGWQRSVFRWALHLATHYELGRKPGIMTALQLQLADRLVFAQWRSGLGGRLKYLLSGGAALKPELANVLSAAGIPVYQGYGLTQSSSVVCVNRGAFNRAGTVGVPIVGVEMALAADNEILVRAPYIMQGYYKNEVATAQAFDRQGWFYTGDYGEFTDEGFLKITGYKKHLFKLSTGKYVAPERIEHALKVSPLVHEAIAIGAHQKFCVALIFPDWDHLYTQVQTFGLQQTDGLSAHASAGEGTVPSRSHCCQFILCPPWSTIKRFQLIETIPTLENGILSPPQQLNREQVLAMFAAEIKALYVEEQRRSSPEGTESAEAEEAQRQPVSMQHRTQEEQPSTSVSNSGTATAPVHQREDRSPTMSCQAMSPIQTQAKEN